MVRQCELGQAVVGLGCEICHDSLSILTLHRRAENEEEILNCVGTNENIMADRHEV
jgi:hypothetical protein